MKIIIKALIISTLFILSVRVASADVSVYQCSAQINTKYTTPSFDERPIIIKNYLEKHNSPMAGHYRALVESADKYELDWRLVTAISGVESTFGKRIPNNSFNAYGWNNGNYYFDSWEDSIDHVSRVLKEKYVDDGLTTVDQMAYRYAPPSSDWAWKVKFFMREIENIPLEFTI